MDEPEHIAMQWLSSVLGRPFEASKHIHSHQDEVYRIVTDDSNYYLKISATLKLERDNLQKLKHMLNVPDVVDFHRAGQKDYLLISELPGKNLVELTGQWPEAAIVTTFAYAVRQLHHTDITALFPEARSEDVLLHGDMALPNIIAQGQGRIGFIDFGQMAFGTPELDLADAIWSLQRNIGPDYGALFLETYGPLVMTPKIEAALTFRYQPKI